MRFSFCPDERQQVAHLDSEDPSDVVLAPKASIFYTLLPCPLIHAATLNTPSNASFACFMLLTFPTESRNVPFFS